MKRIVTLMALPFTLSLSGCAGLGEFMGIAAGLEDSGAYRTQTQSQSSNQRPVYRRDSSTSAAGIK